MAPCDVRGTSAASEGGSCIQFTLNGQLYTLDQSIGASTSLLTFIRDVAKLTGTKGSCYEGGCGACTVVATTIDHETGKPKTFSLRACQALVFGCAGWVVETVEHLGNKHEGYDRIQSALTGFYGTQCGFCSPGMVMTMHGERESSGELKVDRIEKVLDGNICRCTGYRPILDAFKSLAVDAPKHLASQLKDIEEAGEARCSTTGKICTGSCASMDSCKGAVFDPKQSISCSRNGVAWHRPKSLEEIYEVLKDSSYNDKIRFVGGNTGQGVYRRDGPFGVYIDMSGVKELHTVNTETGVFGANVTLTRCIEAFDQMAAINGYAHMKEVADHWRVVANVGIRNTGSWAGNLAMKHDHPEFPSDIFLTLVAIDAKLTLGQSGKSPFTATLEEFQKMYISSTDTRTIILSMEIPKQAANVRLRTFKITPRAVNAHAYLNAAFKVAIDKEFIVSSKPSVLFGGVSTLFVHASRTETVLTGSNLTNAKTISSAMVAIKEDLTCMTTDGLESSTEYRVGLAQSLLYKMLLGIVGEKAAASVRSGASKLERPISSSKQTYDLNEDSWPVGKPMPKLESQIQVSGEAEYVDDIPSSPGELFGVFVQSKVAKAKIDTICADECKKVPGFVDFVCAKDIPGMNSFTFEAAGATRDAVFADKEVNYNGQAIGLVLATNRESAIRASKAVKVQYSNVVDPVVCIKKAIELGRAEKAVNFKTFSTDDLIVGDVEAGYKDSDHVIEGAFEQGTQFHFSMEPNSTVVKPIEDGYDVFVTSQWPTEAQNVIARNLNIDVNCINMSVRRLGGAFGGKISRPHILSSAAAIAAKKTKKSVRITLDVGTHMSLVGWREPYYGKYKVGFTSDGLLKSVAVDIYSDVGYARNECSVGIAVIVIPNCYYSPNWLLRPFSVTTDTATNTYCRTPGHPEGMAIMENLMDRIAHFLKMDPLVIREKNMMGGLGEGKPHGCVTLHGENLVKTSLIPQIKESAELARRQAEVELFNKNNRWKKRALATMPMYYNFDYFPIFRYNTHVVIYETDGSVAIKHGGIEMGQGINTKVAQVAAQTLGIPIEFIRMKPTDSFSGANSTVTGGSFGSELCALAVKVCCEGIRKKIDPVSEKMKSEGKDPSWLELVQQCKAEEVDLCERYYLVPKEYPKGYDIWGVTTTEVEIDVLTGQFLILRADILEDCGRSMSPYIDVGQVEGSFIMGQGFYTLEQVKFDKKTGQKLTNSTWNYKPPTALDIPVDFRVSFMPKGDNVNAGVVRSKATGEPALCMTYSIVMALRQAILAARKDAGQNNWIDMDTPLTVERIRQLCNVVSSQFTY